MRMFPEIAFALDESIDKAFKMMKLLDNLAKEREGGGKGEKE
jgi:ribosome-binding factor A